MLDRLARSARSPSPPGPHRHGIALVVVAILMVIFIGFLGLAVDWLYTVRTAQQLQAAADASALAGALLLRSNADDAVARAVEVAAANTAAGSAVQVVPADGYLTGDVVLGRYHRRSQTVPDPYFEPNVEAPNAVRVTAVRSSANPAGPLGLFFGPIVGVRTVDVSRYAIAMLGGGTGAGLIVLDPDDEPALYIHGNLHLSVSGGDIQVNSSALRAAKFQGSFTLDAPYVNINGGYQVVGNGGDLGDTEVRTGQPIMADPLASIPEPPRPNTAPDPVNRNGRLEYSPGYYPTGLSFNGGNIFFNPGIYYLGGSGYSTAGNPTINGQGVMFFLAGPSAKINLTGNGVTHLTPIEGTQWDGITFFQSRSNKTASSVYGTSGLDLSGTIYLPSAKLNLSGTSDKIGTQLIVGTMEVSGNGNLTINYDGRNPAPGNKVFLVE